MRTSERQLALGDPEAPIAPFLRWAGSKRKLLHHLRPHWIGESGRYLEPFAGSACLFFDLRPEKAVLSDVNVHLMEAYRGLKHRPHQVYRHLSAIRSDESTYYRLRAQDASRLPFARRAARFIYLNRFCFNGIYRTNAAGEFNVPFGGQKSGGIPSNAAMLNCSRALRSATIVDGDFEDVLRDTVKKGDFVYLDPPYALKNRRIHTQYDAFSFGLADLERLAACLDWIVSRGASFVLSYADCSEAREFFSSWPQRVVAAQRNVAGFADRRRVARERIITSWREN